MKYSMEAVIEAERLEEQVFQSNYSLTDELKGFQFRPDEWIMDAGCGTGVLARHLVEQFSVKHIDAVDSSDLRLKQAADLTHGKTKHAISFHQQDLGKLDSKFHGKYDTVICRYVLEHCEDPVHVIRELKKALKPNGRLILVDLDGVFINLWSLNAKLNEYMDEIKRKAKFDLNIGRKLASYLKQVGFSYVDWDAQLMPCKGKRLEEEYQNTEKRFAALIPYLTGLFGSRERCDEFKRLYLEEMNKPENTLVFTKYICSARSEK